jgi:hypothetical protein
LPVEIKPKRVEIVGAEISFITYSFPVIYTSVFAWISPATVKVGVDVVGSLVPVFNQVVVLPTKVTAL